jgi:hypothetical protein
VTKPSSQAALEEMLAWVDRASPQLSAAAESPALRLTFERARRTFAGGVLLTGLDFGPQAAMLARSLFEDVLLAFWMSTCMAPERVEERLQAQRRYRQLLADPSSEGLNDLDRRLLEALFGRRGELSWWSRSVVPVADPEGGQPSFRLDRRRTPWTLIDEVRRRLEQVAEAAPSEAREPILKIPDHLRYLYREVNRFNNELLHHSVTGLSALYEPVASRTTFMIRTALYMTFDMLVFLLVRGRGAVETDYLYMRPRFNPWSAEGEQEPG